MTSPAHTITEMTIEGFSPSQSEKIVLPPVERIGNETLDEAIARKVGYQIENGIVELTEDEGGWKAKVGFSVDGSPCVFQSFKKQHVLNQVFNYLYRS